MRGWPLLLSPYIPNIGFTFKRFSRCRTVDLRQLGAIVVPKSNNRLKLVFDFVVN